MDRVEQRIDEFRRTVVALLNLCASEVWLTRFATEVSGLIGCPGLLVTVVGDMSAECTSVANTLVRELSLTNIPVEFGHVPGVTGQEPLGGPSKVLDREGHRGGEVPLPLGTVEEWAVYVVVLCTESPTTGIETFIQELFSKNGKVAFFHLGGEDDYERVSKWLRSISPGGTEVDLLQLKQYEGRVDIRVVEKTLSNLFTELLVEGVNPVRECYRRIYQAVKDQRDKPRPLWAALLLAEDRLLLVSLNRLLDTCKQVHEPLDDATFDANVQYPGGPYGLEEEAKLRERMEDAALTTVEWSVLEFDDRAREIHGGLENFVLPKLEEFISVCFGITPHRTLEFSRPPPFTFSPNVHHTVQRFYRHRVMRVGNRITMNRDVYNAQTTAMHRALGLQLQQELTTAISQYCESLYVVLAGEFGLDVADEREPGLLRLQGALQTIRKNLIRRGTLAEYNADRTIVCNWRSTWVVSKLVVN